MAIAENDLKFSGKLVDSFICRQLITSKLHEKWFVFARTPLRFSLLEYHVVTGLKITRETNSDVVKWKDHLAVDQKVGVVMGRDEKVSIPHMYIKLVMDFDKVRKFHWGLHSYDFLLISIEKARKKLGKKESYIFEGFSYALQIWIMEAIPDFGEILGRRVSDSFKGPRCGNWKGVAKVSYEDIIELEDSLTKKGEIEDERVDLVLERIRNKYDWSSTDWPVLDPEETKMEEPDCHDRGSEADKSVNHTDVVADEESSSVKVAGKGKRKFLDEGAETRKKKVLCKRSAEKYLTFGPETNSFTEGLIRTSVTSLGDVLSMQMANMERVFTERMGKMEIEVSQLRDAISLTGEGSYPSKKEAEEAPLNIKAKKAPPKSKGAQAPPKSKGAQAPSKRKGDQPTPTNKFLTPMNTSRRHSYGVPSRCWCGKGVVIFYSRTDDSPYRRFYICEIWAQRKKENHLFKWVDDALLDEIRRVEAEQGRIVEEIEDLKSSITQTIEEEVSKQKNSLELGCLGSILWLFGRLKSQE
uniref:GRF-type domain-containing protein n=1 Tax=Brassica oleracea var. oleracea TaxID=109376 RepID=A0A0D3E9C4_BRAOL